jgi:hypothetical protein
MPLEEDDVAVVASAAALEEMVEADLVQGCRGGERRYVAANAVAQLVRANDHRQGVPAHEAFDPPLDRLVAGKRRLL